VALWVAAVLAATFGSTVAADSQSDTFQPDVFGTNSALHRRTSGVFDPQGHNCFLPIDAVSLSDAVELALCRNPTTRSAWAAARQQAAALGQAESAWLPTISATGSESRTLAGDHADALGNIVPGAQNTKDAAATLTWTLYDFGGREGRIRGARHLLDAAAATLNRTAQQVVFTVVQGYYGVVAADASLGAAKTTEAVTAHSVEIADALRTGGVANLGDVLQAETAHGQALLARIQAEATAKTARGQLANILAAPADTPFKLLPEPVPAEVQPLSVRVQDLMEEAAQQRPDLAAALAQRDASEQQVTVARALGRPSISFQAGHELSDTTGIPNQSYNQIGIYLTVPIFTGFNVGYGVRQAQATLAGQEANAEQVRLQVSLDVWNAYYSLESANQQLGATTSLTKTAQDNQDAALGRYQSGVGTILDVLTAQTAAANARQLRINAELAWKVARAQLALALGRLTGSQPLAGEETLP
jgi:TolC family type I secretion outer membrane protein